MTTEKLQTAYDSVAELLRREGRSLSETDRVLLTKPTSQIEESDQPEVVALEEAMNCGFYKCAAEGYAFTLVSRIKERFGRSLEENYPGGSHAFLRFATSYWTLKLVQDDLWRDREHSNKLIFQLLSGLDLNIGSVFFPTPGPHKIPANLREQEQRRLILASGAKIDIEEFIKGNPILRSRSIHGKRSGCMGIVALLTLFVVIIIWILA